MTTWGNTVNGAWKLGYDFRVMYETDTFIDVELIISIWTRYATWERSNGFSVTGAWTGTEMIQFDVRTNRAWSTNNIARIWSKGARIPKGQTASFTARLTGVNYPNGRYVETVSGSYTAPLPPLARPALPVSANARLENGIIKTSWVNGTGPIEQIQFGYFDGTNWTWNGITTLGPVSSYDWSGAQPGRVYHMAIRPYNRTAWADGHGVTNAVKTKPLTPLGVTGTSRVTGLASPKTQTADLTWSYPGHALTVDGYRVVWSGPTSGSMNVSGRSASIPNLLAGSTYSFRVFATNIGDGVTGQVSDGSVPFSINTLGVIDLPAAVTATAKITGATAPRSSSMSVSWTPVAGALSYALTLNGAAAGTTTGTSHVIDGVPAGTRAVIGVAPVNAAGGGRISTAVVQVPGLPSPPAINSARSGPGGLSVVLSAGDPNGSSILHYEYQLNGGPWTRVPSMSFVVSADPGSTHTVSARSVNGVGLSATTSLRSDITGGYIRIFDQGQWITKYIPNSMVRVYDGQNWNLAS